MKKYLNAFTWIYCGVCFAFVGYALFNPAAKTSDLESLKKYQDLKFENLQRRIKALEEQNKKWMLPPSGKGWEFGR